MATIKQIDGRSVHQIQSGQVIVDLCSVAKELVENSIDAGATIIDVRFKNQGLDLIEVQDNGSGVSPANYASVALKHCTSKLSSYSDIASLQTFGFRGEALASLCALSTLTVTTCLADDVPKGSRLTFEPSGRLKGTSVVAAQRGTTVSVEKLFHNLPVRRRELDRNIKREWHKVIALLNQYACILTNVKFSVSQQPTKGKRIVLFSTKGNPSTRDNIINIFGAKTMTALVSLDLSLEMNSSSGGPGVQAVMNPSSNSNDIRIVGHVSRPVHGDGRQTPDRQMFFVNGRPCALPQFAKTFNEVYRSYNYSQSPFIFADIQLDTGLYDVNVSPDKRSILLHDQRHLLDTLRTSLTKLFDAHEYTVPVSRPLGSARQLSFDDEPPPKATSPWAPDNPAVKPQTASVSDSNSDDEDAITDSSVKKGMQERVQIISSRSRLTDERNQNLISNWAKQTVDTGTLRQNPPASREAFQTTTRSAAPLDKALGDAPAKFCNQVASAQEMAPQEFDRDKPMLAEEPNKRLAGTHTVVFELRTTSTSPPTTPENASPLHNSHIPLVQDLNLNSAAASGNSVRAPESPKRRASDIHTIVIGSEGAQDLIESPPKPHSTDHPEMESGETRSSFGKQLSHLFAAREGEGHVSTPETDASCRPKSVSPNSRENPPNASNASENDAPSDMDSLHQDESHSKDPSPGIEDRLEPGADTDQHDAKTEKPRTQICQTGPRRKDATTQFVHRLRIDEGSVRSCMRYGIDHAFAHGHATSDALQVEDIDAADAESKLPLIIAKRDFARMRVAGQFNLGFIIAVRPAKNKRTSIKAKHDELFIIDQHASDEKYNFEKLQNTTTIQAQRLVHPKRLQLTALEEEIILENETAMEANGFKMHTDTTGHWPVGSRCQLMALPLSRETTFNLEDLEELVSLLGDESSESSRIPRPSKVRKMLAMRACRSSVMIGKALTRSQMYTLVKHMGELDKPWNCPHGRPTMRHLSRLQSRDGNGWKADVDGDSVSLWQRYSRGD